MMRSDDVKVSFIPVSMNDMQTNTMKLYLKYTWLPEVDSQIT